MNKKMIFRILGALSGALIIVSVFVPFVSVLGYSASLWSTEKSIDALYLPIMIMAFGCLITVLFALNKKLEFAYTGVGAVLFFTLTQTIDVLRQGMETFSSLSVGYYFLVIGTVLSGVMVFLMSRLNKENITDNEVPVSNNDNLFTPSTQDTLIENQNQVDQLQPVQNDLNQASIAPTPINNLNNTNVNQPLESTNLETQNLNQEEKIEPLGNAIATDVEQIQPVNPVVQDLVQVAPVDSVNPTTQSLNQEEKIEPLGSTVTTGLEQTQTVNSATQDLVQDIPVQPIGASISETAVEQPINPVVQEFSNSMPTPTNNFISTPASSPSVDTNESKLSQENSNNSMDIFG